MFLDHWSLICSRHKEETLTFLTVKTAAVRCGAKPAELLRVPLCGRAGMAGCDAVRNVFARLGLPYRILSEDAGGALALFYHPTRLNEALSDSRASAFLTRPGLPGNALTLFSLNRHHHTSTPSFYADVARKPSGGFF